MLPTLAWTALDDDVSAAAAVKTAAAARLAVADVVQVGLWMCVHVQLVPALLEPAGPVPVGWYCVRQDLASGLELTP